MSKIESLRAEKCKLEEKLTKLLRKFEDMENDNEDTWGGHDGPQMLFMENQKYLLDAMIQEVRKELIKLGYKD